MSEYSDLARLARKRCRDSVTSVTQLLDNDAERAALIASCAIDFINGATVMLTDEEENVSKEEAFATVLGLILNTLGVEKVIAAIDMTERRKSR